MERTTYLGTVLQNMLRGYTDAAVSFTTGLLTFISRFALQVLLAVASTDRMIALESSQRCKAPFEHQLCIKQWLVAIAMTYTGLDAHT